MMMGPSLSHFSLRNKTNLAILVAALGYFVDVFDMLLFPALRVSSLQSLGLSPTEITDAGIMILNWQMAGMLLGGVVWGVLGDKRGRVQVLFGSILLYSIGNIVNAFVNTVEAYAAVRFMIGLGLAGEVGAGITLVSELMSKETRGYGTTIVAPCGVSGAIGAAFVAEYFDWRTAYIIGGVLGLLLLVLRISVSESGLFQAVAAKAKVKRGNFFMLFTNWKRFLRYFACIIIAVPIWYVVGVMAVLAPEVGSALVSPDLLYTPRVILVCYIGLTVGGAVSGLLSQYFRNRKKVMWGFIVCDLLINVVLLNFSNITAFEYYLLMGINGFFIGYWTLFISTAAEQFGTNIRATAAVTIPNFVRAAVIPINLLIATLKPEVGFLMSIQITGLVCFILAAMALWYLPETYARDLNFTEE